MMRQGADAAAGRRSAKSPGSVTTRHGGSRVVQAGQQHPGRAITRSTKGCVDQQGGSIEDLPQEILAIIISKLNAPDRKVLRTTSTLLRNLASTTFNTLTLDAKLHQELSGAGRRHAPCLHIGRTLPSITACIIKPPLSYPGTLVHKLLQQLPSITKLTFNNGSEGARQAPTLKPLSLCPSLQTSLRDLTFHTFPSNITPLSALTALTALRLPLHTRPPPSLLTPLSNLTLLHTLDISIGFFLDARHHPTLLDPLHCLPHLQQLTYMHLTNLSFLLFDDFDCGYPLSPLTRLSRLTITCNSPLTTDSLLTLTSLAALSLLQPYSDFSRFWQAPARPTFPHLRTLTAPLRLLECPACPHMPALRHLVIDTPRWGARADIDADTFLHVFSKLPLADLLSLELTLANPAQLAPVLTHLRDNAPALHSLCVRALKLALWSGPALCGHLAELSSCRSMKLVCPLSLNPPSNEAKILAALNAVACRLQQRLPGLQAVQCHCFG